MVSSRLSPLMAEENSRAFSVATTLIPRCWAAALKDIRVRVDGS